MGYYKPKLQEEVDVRLHLQIYGLTNFMEG
jgi:hypothetical protein